MTPPLRFVVVLVACVLAVAAAVATAYVADAGCLSNESALLVKASTPGDAIEPRWSGCFDRPRQAFDRPALVTPLQVRGAVAGYELASRRGRSSMQDFGAALALSGEAVRAVATLSLDEGAAAEPDQLSNLAAAYLLAAAQTHNTTHLFLALEHASHAVSLAPRHHRALFNQALALTELRLADEAERAWRHYLEVDRESAWSRDVRARLADPARRQSSAAAQFDDRFARRDVDVVTIARLCADAAQTCRQQLEETLLPQWADAHLRGDAPAASEALSLARVLADTLRTRGDGLDADAVTDLERAVRGPLPRLRDLALGLDAYGRARRAFENDEESISLFGEAEKRLSAAVTPLSGWVRANRVYAEFNTYSGERLDAVAATLREWQSEALTRGYAALAGRLAYLEALTFVNRAEYQAAEPLMQASVDALLQTNEPDHLAATYVLLAGARMRLGDVDAGWKALGQALAVMPDIRGARRRYAILLAVSGWMRERGLPYSAVEVLSSAIDTAHQSQQVFRVAEASLDRAKAYGRIGDIGAARDNLEVARPDPARNGRWGRGERARYEYLAGVAEVERNEQPQVAIAAASEALAFFAGRQAAQRVASLYLMRGRAYRAAGDLDRAEADFAAGIEAYLRYRSALSSAQQRLLSQEVVWDLYEERLQLAAQRSPASAFDVAEQGRARTLIESVPGHDEKAAPLSRLQRQLRGDTRVVYYALLPQQLLVWVIGADAITLRQVRVDRRVLEQRVATWVSALEHDAPQSDWTFNSQQLFDQLIAPVADVIPAEAPLVVLPDGALHRVPFAALVDRRSGRYLIETHTVTTAPSATLLARLLERRAPRTASPSLFGVADPVVSDAVALAGADRETRSIARLYERTELVSRDRATKAAFVMSAPRADVVHFAGHAVASPEYPLLGHLDFAPEPGTPGPVTLDAEGIAAMRLDRTRLVVLAACTTAGGPIRRGEGVLSLARPFLIAGAPSVVATLWDINDSASATFLSVFHQEFVKGRDPGHALRDAQVSAIGTLRPGTWAAFVLIGRPDDVDMFSEDGSR